MVRGEPDGRHGASLTSLRTRALDPFPQLRGVLASAHVALPSPLSRWAYHLGRNALFPDPRRAGFERAMAEAAVHGGGDYLEFGVHRGASIVLAYDCAKCASLDAMRFVAFDSFKGLPGDETSLFWQGRFRFSKQRFLQYVAKAGVDLERVVTIPGWFADTLTPRLTKEHGISRIAIAHIDCDLYTSGAEALRWLEPHVSAGAVLIFDDWYAYDGEPDPAAHGAQRALAESPLHERLEVLYNLPGVHRICVVRD